MTDTAGTSQVEDVEVADAPADPHALDAAHADLLERFERELGDAVIESAPTYGTPVVRVRRDAWRQSAEVAKTRLDCDYLSFVAGLDWMPAPKEGDEDSSDTSSPVQPQEPRTASPAPRAASRCSRSCSPPATTSAWSIKADVDEQAMLVESWVPVYAGADWHERECWEMYGVVFDGHPALRHLYLPSEFEGHPLRKDFPLLSRVVKPWPGLVDVEPMPGDDAPADDAASRQRAEEDAE